ncbi:AAA family ATPase [Persicobacter diffluens]|uniref:Sporulation initiation inhibitor Soj n=1 Tax=Persicobacter diffluens TaxID=981 RepID=A0AAN4W2K1_9BACT|nr:sporulation initiation inhibitor Soj [Persicobacter diffluens]
MGKQQPFILAFANRKGGVAKTTSVASMGACLARLGYRTLIMDLDSQGNLSNGLGFDMSDDRNITSVFRKNYKLEDIIISLEENLHMTSSNDSLADYETELNASLGREFKLKKTIEEVEDRYDFILLDCPPSLGIITVNALVAANKVIVPLHAQKYSLDGLKKVISIIEEIKEAGANQTLNLAGAFFTQYNSRAVLSQEAVNQVRDLIGEQKLMTTNIRQNISLAESVEIGQHILDYAPTSNGATDYMKLTEELVKNLN